ncbi:hypothetical protein Deipe_1068 [Deinococcus peraridilitoris DSM 19664]|uniref:Uncharacterized protein n=1 Tax=Deinococcus peraridilitoris (strain DSM 19664 / LMG 22246 / CIP 109416 / KR-200) TaxID=937777 RepID=K9ZYI3_DEIPD|nr:hypothetical protein Deipe_1068 [Deinococcus peraridilitoris DSM 19664]
MSRILHFVPQHRLNSASFKLGTGAFDSAFKFKVK